MSVVQTPEKTVLQSEEQAPSINLSAEQITQCRVALAQSVRRVVAFYSNPRLRDAAMMLNLTRDMSTIVSLMNPFDYYLAHYTNEEIFTKAIIRFQPEIICYFGHADGNSLYLESADPRYVFQPMNSDTLIEKLKLNRRPMKCVALFACSSAEIARKISDQFKTTYVIFWHTKTLDKGAQIFARAFIEYIAKFKSGQAFRPEHAFHDGYERFAKEFKIGDPLLKHATWMAEIQRARHAHERPDPSLRPADGIPGIMVNGHEIAINDIRERRTISRSLHLTDKRSEVAYVQMPSLKKAERIAALKV